MTGRPGPLRRWLVAGLAALALTASLTACGATGGTPGGTATGTAAGTAGPRTTATSSSTGGTSNPAGGWDDNVASHADADDAEYDAAAATTIRLADGASTASGAGAAAVRVSGNTVTISAPGTYLVSGALADGQLVVDSQADGKVRLVLAGASISSSTGSALVVNRADEVVVVLAAGSRNQLSDGSSYGSDDSETPVAALSSTADLTIGGTGTLLVKGNSNDAIASKDGLVIQSGTLEVAAVDDGIRGKDYVIIEGGTVTVDAKGDAVKSDNETDDTVGYVSITGGTVTLAAGDDGIHAEGDLRITDGAVTVTQSVEGLEGVTVTVSGGTVDITSSDDGLNATTGAASQGGGGGMGNDGSRVLISGGVLTVDAEGDGIDSNGDLTITGGTIVVHGPTRSGNGALDANGTITVSGGTVVAAGSAGMAETPEAGDLGWVAVALPSPAAAGTTIVVSDGSTVIGSYTAKKSTATLVVAAGGIAAGKTYTFSTLAGTRDPGWSVGGTLTGASQVATATAGQRLAGGMGGRGGR